MQAPSKLKVIVSDFHIGDGRHLPDGRPNTGEDFHYDIEFCAMLQYYMDMYPNGGDVELIINGDFLNFIFVSFRGAHPIHMTEQMSLEKLKSIIRAHPYLFDQMMQFAKKPGFRLAYVIGNHDFDMVWPACQDYFRKRMEADISFYPLAYVFDGIHVEHGNRFELMNAFDSDNPILTEGDASFLNLPLGSLFASLFVAPLKVRKPYIDKIKPFRVFLMLDLMMHFPSAVQVWIQFLTFFSNILFSPYRERFPAVRNALRIMITGLSMYPSLDRCARALLRSNRLLNTVIFGHSHVWRYAEFHDRKLYVNSGTWNEITTLDLNQFGRRELRTFVEIRYLDGENTPPYTRLRVWQGNWEPVRTVY